MCRPKTYVFALFDLKTDINLKPFLARNQVWFSRELLTGMYDLIMRVICEFEMDFKKSFCWRSQI